MRCTVGTPAGCCRSSSCRLSQVARDDQPPTVRIRRSTHIGRRIGRLDPAIPAARDDPPPRVFGRGSCAILRDQLRDGLGDTRRFALDAPRGGARSSRVRPRCARQDARLASVSSLRVLSQRCGESTTGRTPGVFRIRVRHRFAHACLLLWRSADVVAIGLQCGKEKGPRRGPLLRGDDSNVRPSGYEPDELPLLHPATIILTRNRVISEHRRTTRPIARSCSVARSARSLRRRSIHRAPRR